MVLTLIALVGFQASRRVNEGRKLTDLLSNQYNLIFQQTDLGTGWLACNAAQKKESRVVANPGSMFIMRFEEFRLS